MMHPSLPRVAGERFLHDLAVQELSEGTEVVTQRLVGGARAKVGDVQVVARVAGIALVVFLLTLLVGRVVSLAAGRVIVLAHPE